MSAEPSAFLSLMRGMQESDLPAVVAVERSAYEFPWNQNIFRDCLRMGYDCAVQVVSDRLVGYLILAYGGGEAHVLNLAVHPDVQNQGYGGRLLRRAMRQAQRFGADAVFLEVRPSNPAAVHLYYGNGFRLVGRRRDYYPSEDGREDALVMRRGLQPGTGVE